MFKPKAVIFGAIGTIAETSDIQRRAFNMAFEAAGLNWSWDMETYRDLLNINGGQNRIRAYRDANPEYANVTDEMIISLHADKTRHYAALLSKEPLHPRRGVVDLINACKSNGIPVAFCTSTSQANVNALGAALADSLPLDWFTTIITIDQIPRPKPAPDAYLYCLERLDLKADQVIAIEDTPVSIASAKAANIKTIATPGATTSKQDFSAADWVLSSLDTIAIQHLGLPAVIVEPALPDI
jgi:HAD superfamily hydrolase (TIGR01509 family)